MPYTISFALLLVAFIGTLVWLLVVKGQLSVFTKKTLKFVALMVLLFVFLGMLGFLTDDPMKIKKKAMLLPSLPILAVAIILQFILLFLGLWYDRLLHKYFPNLEQYPIARTPLMLLLVIIGAITFFLSFWAVEVPVFKANNGVADELTLSFALLLIPSSILAAHRYWNKIPIIVRNIVPWALPNDNKLKIIEPSPDSNAIQLNFAVPYDYQSKRKKRLDLKNIPLVYSLGELFHARLYEHNKNDPTKIIYAENNKRSKIYSWLFYKKVEKWWGFKKVYLDPDKNLAYLEGIDSGDIIFVERIRTWNTSTQNEES